MKTHLDYNIALATHGDNACNSTSSVLTLEDGTAQSFRLFIDETDLETALSTEGWNMSVAIESANATGAKISIGDGNAATNATAPALGWVAPENYDCTVLVNDFCL